MAVYGTLTFERLNKLGNFLDLGLFWLYSTCYWFQKHQKKAVIRNWSCYFFCDLWFCFYFFCDLWKPNSLWSVICLLFFLWSVKIPYYLRDLWNLAVTLFNYLIVGGDRGMNRHLISLSDTPGGELYRYQCLSCWPPGILIYLSYPVLVLGVCN